MLDVQNLLINVLGWTFLLLLFGVLRRAAGNYGRLAVIRREDDESRWTQVFFSTTDNEEPLEDNIEVQGGKSIHQCNTSMNLLLIYKLQTTV